VIKGILSLTMVEDIAELDSEDLNLEVAGAIYIRVSRFPYGFARASTTGSLFAPMTPGASLRH
jgi:hypothetical protein